jgi:ParB-like chromosome segregation protein Spo0J
VDCCTKLSIGEQGNAISVRLKIHKETGWLDCLDARKCLVRNNYKLTFLLKYMVNELVGKLIEELKNLKEEERILALNELKTKIHEISPFKDEPVDCVLWVKKEEVVANDYNPNNVAPPEMELLKTSILADGFTQPIVVFPEKDNYTVIDGFHRNRVGKEIKEITEKLKGYLPVTIIRPTQEDRGDRIASTIRHNRARGKHKIDSMSDIVLELKRRNWSDEKIAKNLGMDADEILRLAQITGLKEMFADKDFSLSWEVGVDEGEDDIELFDEVKSAKDIS